MKSHFKLVLIFVLAISLPLGLFSNGLNLNGNGSKAISMGGAFVGLADDYSAAYWNPAGLTQLKETSLSFFVTDIMPSANYKFDLVGADSSTESKHYFSGSLGFFKPVSEKVTVGFYAYVPAGSGATWDGAGLSPLTDGVAYEWESLVGIATISPVIAVKVTEKLSLGATLNINYGLVKMKRPMLGQYEEDLNGMSVGASISMLFKPSRKFSFGLTYKTPFKVKVSGEADMPGAALLGMPTSSDAERETTWPMWIGTGVCFRPNEKLTFTADVQYTNWKVMTTIPMNFYNTGWKVAFEDAADFELKWKDAIQLRVGMEYKISKYFAVRAGYYRDPDPSPKETMTVLLPEVVYNWFTWGFGYSKGSITLDVGIEHAFGIDEEVSLLEVDPRAGMPGIHSADLFVATMALTIRF